MAAQTLIAAVTGAVSTQVDFKITSSMLPVTILTEGLDSGETVTLHSSPDDGTTFSPLYKDGTAVTIATQDGCVVIDYPIYLGVTKTATAAACGVYAAYSTKV
jgi:hypothetical protein